MRKKKKVEGGMGGLVSEGAGRMGFVTVGEARCWCNPKVHVRHRPHANPIY